MVDIDHFKKVNDEYGHPVGDEVIRRLASSLQGGVRSTDLVCRWGGEEFILLIGANIERASATSTRLCREIDSPGFARVPVTASFGVASVAGDVENVQDLINRADEALYASKNSGRNRVTRWDEMDSQANPSSEGNA
jgi:diguanylate cyclase (GGDEF)-like protein